MYFDGDTRLLPAVEDLGVSAVKLTTMDSEADAVALHDAGIVDLVFVGLDYEGEVDLSVPSWVEAHFVMNTRADELGAVETRLALANAVSRSAVTSTAFGAAAAPIDRVAPNALACADPCGGEGSEALPFLPELAVAYVDEPSGAEARLATAVAVELAFLGAGAESVPYELERFVELITTGNHHVVRSGWVGLFASPDSQLAPYLSDSPDNVSGYGSEVFDDAFAAARRSGNPAIYAEAASILRADSVAIPVARLHTRALVSDDVEKLDLRPDGSFDITKIWVDG